MVFWAFGNSLYNIRWRYSLRELRQYIQIKVGETQIKFLQDFEVMAKILTIAFGGSKKETKIESRDQLSAALERMKR